MSKHYLLGTLEIALFMLQGSRRFQSCRAHFLRSLLIPLCLLPLTLIPLLAAHPDGILAPSAYTALSIIYALRLFVSLGLFLGLVYFMTYKMNRSDDFYRFAIANNWLTIPAIVFMLPLSLGFLSGAYSWAEVYPLMVFMTLYSYAVTAFMATHVLRIPYELACFIAVAGMAIHQSSLQAIKLIAANTLTLIS